ncbi:MAG: phospho-sugar mutase [Clostridia bacterium]|nr:phospho-sugar mutase [Clostridia bacterium]
MKNYEIEYKRWLASESLTDCERAELVAIAHDEEAKELRFGSPMSFGTAGLRSTMSMGIGCMNRFTVASATRGIAALVKKEGGEKRGVAIACDSRNNSMDFAKICACVLAGEGIRAFIFDDIRPTPELSFAVRECGALAGINITASHNPKEYNGYKAYWEDGAQLAPEHASIVAAAMAEFDPLDLSGIADFDEAVRSGLITVLGAEFDEKYLAAVLGTAINPSLVEEVADELKVVYTPLHGAGRVLVPEVFRRLGLKHLYLVESQMQADGNFPTVKKPNPEYPDVFTDGIEIANRVGSDLIIATDPDSDRVGVMTRTPDGSFTTITGNQMGALLLDYAISERRKAGRLEGAFCVKSIVSTDMAYKIAKDNGVVLHDVLTGFKFIGEVIKNYEREGKESGFILGFEESYGYLLGSYARDKDAVEASMMILEMTAFYKKKGMTLSDALAELYKRYGFYKEGVIDIYMEGLDGIERRKRIMQSLRDNAPTEIGGVKVASVGDYKSGEVKDMTSGAVSPTGQPSSDVLYYTLENGDKVIVRPSGTEPKIKIYILAHDECECTLAKKLEAYERDGRRMTAV